MIANLQLLRGIAAMMIVVIHLKPILRPLKIEEVRFDFLFGGVDIFFVISGFIMVFVTENKSPKPTDFLIDRIIRILPVYWLFTIVIFLLYLFVPQLAENTPTASQFFKSLFFIPYGDPPLFYPVLFVGWSLNLEVYFYLLFAVGLALSSNSKTRLLVMAGLLTIAVLFGNQSKPDSVVQFYALLIVFEFFLGMIIAEYREKIYTIGSNPAIIIGIVGFLLLVIDPFRPIVNNAFFRFGPPAVMLVICAIVCEAHGKRISSRFTMMLGAISYVLYISHPLVLSAFNNIQERVAILQTKPAAMALALTAITFAVLFAWMTHHLFERPVSRFLKSLLTKSPPAKPAISKE